MPIRIAPEPLRLLNTTREIELRGRGFPFVEGRPAQWKACRRVGHRVEGEMQVGKSIHTPLLDHRGPLEASPERPILSEPAPPPWLNCDRPPADFYRPIFPRSRAREARP